MKKQLLFLSVLLTIGTVLSMGCMDRKPAPVCPVPTELKASDPGLGGFEGVDILVVVDNSSSMAAEQQILATAFFPLVNSLLTPTPDWEFDPADDVRIAITTTDMGVSFAGNPYNEVFTPHDACTGTGDNGAFVDTYLETEVDILENVIPCGANAAQCPTAWECNIADGEIVGKCVDPNGDGTAQSCPLSPADSNLSYVDETWDQATAAFTTACLASVGLDGCAFEQQLAAGAAGLANNPSFIRAKSLTTVMIVSDEEDCSLESDDWHTVDELYSTERNIACGRHKDLLTEVSVIKGRYDRAKEDVSGSSNGLLFAAIVGVPPIPACEGAGSGLSACLSVDLAEGGTVGDPAVIEREDPNGNLAWYYEYACQRFDESDPTVALTQAYPGTRYVAMAQLYDDMSYVYSICNADWSEAMVDIAALIAKNLGGTCYGKRLNWDPATETAGCNVVYDYKTLKPDNKTRTCSDDLDCPTRWDCRSGNCVAPSGAPSCPNLPENYEWKDDGELTESSQNIAGDEVAYWVRSCTVKKIAAPLNCSEFEGAEAAENNRFGWYYCENPGENNSVACGDGLDNDRDGLIDGDDEDCNICLGVETGTCPKDCPYKVSISGPALSEAANADDTNVVCLQQYRFEDPNCKESTYDSCNDGEDNDGNGPFDCNSYAKGETIKDTHYPSEGPRNADPDCCPMLRDPDSGVCQFLNARGEPVGAANAAWADNCNVNATPAAMPDSCCEAATSLLCQLPGDFRNACAE